jgi:hypothetical protein
VSAGLGLDGGGGIWNGGPHSGVMARQLSGAPPPDYEAPYRLVVKAASSSRKGFIWEIFGGEPKQTVIWRSSESFKTMENAYANGAVALGLIRKPS